MVKEIYMSESQENLPFEQALEKLQVTVRRLESGELSLEESLKSFEEGVRLTRSCQKYLSEAEKRVELLSRVSADGEITTRPFEDGGK